MEPAQGPQGWPLGPRPQIPTLSAGRRGPERSSDFPSNPELSQVSKFSPNWATQPAKRLCPRGQGSEVRQLLPQKGSGPLYVEGTSPSHRPPAGTGAKQQISSVRRPGQGRGRGLWERPGAFIPPFQWLLLIQVPRGLNWTQPLNLIIPPSKAPLFSLLHKVVGTAAATSPSRLPHHSAWSLRWWRWLHLPSLLGSPRTFQWGLFKADSCK